MAFAREGASVVAADLTEEHVGETVRLIQESGGTGHRRRLRRHQQRPDPGWRRCGRPPTRSAGSTSPSTMPASNNSAPPPPNSPSRSGTACSTPTSAEASCP
ncbi:MAG TPA: hypothetical protein VG455_15735 [Acidimicrobiales bacterium]|nr:hypothetical protein [Acidimicrobiales bacterium]